MCGSHVPANRIHECVWVNERAPRRMHSAEISFIKISFYYFAYNAQSDHKACNGKAKGKKKKKKGPDLFRPGHEHGNKDLLPLNMDSPRPWHVCQKYAEIVVKFKLEIERERRKGKKKEGENEEEICKLFL